jgi:hypothetical protein
VRFIEWLKGSWRRLNGVGSCYKCQKQGRLTWIREYHKDASGVKGIEYKAWLCDDCFKARAAKWEAAVEEMRKGMDRFADDMKDMFKGF